MVHCLAIATAKVPPVSSAKNSAANVLVDQISSADDARFASLAFMVSLDVDHVIVLLFVNGIPADAFVHLE